jgi:hypothetical protein
VNVTIFSSMKLLVWRRLQVFPRQFLSIFWKIIGIFFYFGKIKNKTLFLLFSFGGNSKISSLNSTNFAKFWRKSSNFK